MCSGRGKPRGDGMAGWRAKGKVGNMAKQRVTIS